MNLPLCERGVIVGLLSHPSDFGRVRELISPADFADPRFGAVFGWMLELGTADYALVIDDARRRGLLTEDAEAELVAMARGPLGFPVTYARALRCGRLRREAAESAETLAQAARDARCPEELERAISDVAACGEALREELAREESIALRAPGGEGVAA